LLNKLGIKDTAWELEVEHWSAVVLSWI